MPWMVLLFGLLVIPFGVVSASSNVSGMIRSPLCPSVKINRGG